MRKFKPRICEKCKKEYIPSVGTQKYCGSRTKKIGCSWKIRHFRDTHRYLDLKHKEYQKEYQSEWRKEQRRLNTDYAKRQRKLKIEYSKTKRGKEMYKNSRKRNMKTILEGNRKRQLLKKGVIGTHKPKEWFELKRKYNFCCMGCGISEDELKEKYKETYFTKLTRDHIIPINKGGTDFINNIQPLCVSCNAKKRDKIIKKSKESLVAVSGYFNPVHVGHLRMFEEAKKYGNKLIVIVNSDAQVKIKGSRPFYDEVTRLSIIAAFRAVDNVILAIDKDGSVSKTLQLIKPDAFLNGGDRYEKNTPENEVCKRLNIKQIFNVGGEKIQSSSELIKNMVRIENDRKKYN